MYNKPIGGFIKVINRGAFVAAFSLTYYIKGKMYVDESVSIPVLWDYTLHIPWNATNITLDVQIAMFIGVWRTIYTENFKNYVNKCYLTQGVTVDATCTEIQCPDSNNGFNGNNNNVCLCNYNYNYNHLYNYKSLIQSSFYYIR